MHNTENYILLNFTNFVHYIHNSLNIINFNSSIITDLRNRTYNLQVSHVSKDFKRIILRKLCLENVVILLEYLRIEFIK